MKEILARLFEQQTLSREEAKSVLLDVTAGKYNEAQMTAFLTCYRMRPISAAELKGFRDALLERCLKVDLGGQDTLDIVGTGGDGKNTFNISTLSAFVVAAAGYKVTKHGNYGVSSNCGSSNVLEHLGYTFTTDADTLRRQLDVANICFLHAPLFHPAMKSVAPIRRQLGIKTFFNMLGPLVNPCQATYNVFGVFDLNLSRLYDEILSSEDRHYAVVYALDGYDEISLTGPFKLRSSQGESVVHPDDIGQAILQQQDLYGGADVPSAAKIFRAVLQGEGTAAQQAAVSANAGLAIHVIEPDRSLLDCIGQAAEIIQSGQAYQHLKKITQN